MGTMTVIKKGFGFDYRGWKAAPPKNSRAGRRFVLVFTDKRDYRSSANGSSYSSPAPARTFFRISSASLPPPSFE